MEGWTSPPDGYDWTHDADPRLPGGYAYDGRDGSLEDVGDDEDYIAEQDRIMQMMREAR